MKEMHCMQKLQAMIYVPIIISVWEAWAESPKLVGLHSGELSSGHLIIPRRVNENGAFLSYNLTYQHNEHYYHEPHRRKRRGVHDCKDGIIHYQLQLPEETLHLELEPHNYFMTPHLIVERHRRDLRSRRKPTAKNTNCHFHGEIRGHADSKVAISTCAGLVGHIKSKNNEYFIEPSKEHKLSTLDGHPHVVFQRPAVKQKKYNKSKRKKHKKSKKPTKQALKRKQNFVKQSILSNCGTKEPRRHLETRLEWRQKGKIKIQDGRHIRGRHNRNYNQNHIQEPALHLRSKTLASLPAAIRRRRTYNEISNNSYTITNSYNNNNINVASSNESNNYYVQHSNIHDRQWRKKRSISSPRHVETLLVADATMAAIHEDVDTYLLTIMNMVSSLYKDPSIGNFIEIVVVKIIQLEHDDAHLDLNLTQNAQQNLDMFCKWQHKLNEGNDNDPHHHDVAILLTRKNICGNNCMTLGLANVGGMCKPKQSCSVNEDNGIMLSHTVAHELGHNFGMFHDSAKIGCHPRIGSIVHIMTPTFGADTLQVSWSNCSRKFITQFLDQGLGDCLDDEPTPSDEYYYPVYQPGVIFNAEIQCRLQFNITDGDVGPCSTPNEFCSTLWCRVNGECVTNMRPTAPGTSCGKNKWCQKGDCVRMKNITVLDGGWGNWSEWSECTSSCGGGISIQQRECNNPVPANGGLFCIGERKRYNICQTQDCPSEKSSFRAQQCSRFDKVPYQGHIYKWLPHFDKKNPCKLFCTDEDDTIIAHWKDLVEDGTPCKLGTNNMCIDGICRKVGCDWELDSEVEEDRCGICGGNGDHCKTIKEVFIEPFNTTDNYVEIVTIPAKARQIVIKELANSPHFLSIAEATPGDSNSIKFYLNGDNLISMPGEFIIAGAESLYERNDDQEVISIPHSIDHAIMLYIVVSGTDPNEGVYYEFTLPALNSSDFDQIANYSWKLSHWTACSATCGGGQQYREVACYKNDEYLNNDVPCWLKVTEARPLRKTRSCNVHRCPSHWWTGPWSFCPDNCKNSPEEPALKRRSVMCLNHQEVVVEDIHCNLETRPADSEPCIQYLTNCQSENKLDTFFLQVPDL